MITMETIIDETRDFDSTRDDRHICLHSRQTQTPETAVTKAVADDVGGKRGRIRQQLREWWKKVTLEM